MCARRLTFQEFTFTRLLLGALLMNTISLTRSGTGDITTNAHFFINAPPVITKVGEFQTCSNVPVVRLPPVTQKQACSCFRTLELLAAFLHSLLWMSHKPPKAKFVMRIRSNKPTRCTNRQCGQTTACNFASFETTHASNNIGLICFY